MRGLDALAATCAPQKETENAGPTYAALTDEQCQKIATMVIAQLQGQSQKTEPETPDTEESGDGDGEGENENVESID